ncbi:hypothetical protein BGZ81_008623 [Podila clonocystis]|nr:hypothetical protein BGZ81_008623 [Podila clonocystis]
MKAPIQPKLTIKDTANGTRLFGLEFPDLSTSPISGLPIVHGVPESPAVIRGNFLIQSEYDFKGIEVRVHYTAKAIVGVTMGTNRIDRIDLLDEASRSLTPTHAPGKPNTIAAGTYRLPFEFTIHPTIPPSCLTEFSAVRFEIQGRITRGTWSKDLLTTPQCIHVAQSRIPAPIQRSLAVPGGLESVHLMRTSGIWSRVQPYEVLWKDTPVAFGQIVPTTLRIFPPQNQIGAISVDSPIVAVESVEMVMEQFANVRDHPKSHKLWELNHTVSRTVMKHEQQQWQPVAPGVIWTTDLVFLVPGEAQMLASLESSCLIVKFVVEFKITCRLTNGTTNILVAYVPLQVTAPRPSSDKDKMPTPAEAMAELAHYVQHFTAQPISDYGQASVPLETGLTRVMSPKKYTFTAPTMTAAASSTKTSSGVGVPVAV